MQTVKHSHQRDAILENLRARTDHPTADEIYFDLKALLPNLSLATLYRNLAMLSENGTILKLRCGTADRFDGNPMLHYHLNCEACGRLYDIEMPPFHSLDSEAAKYYQGEIHGHYLIFTGLCENCKNGIIPKQ